MFSELFRNVIVLFLLLAGPLVAIFVNWDATPILRNLSPQGREAVSTLLVFTGSLLLYVGWVGLQSWKAIRDLRSPEARYEGLWLQRVGRPERPYSLSRIHFDERRRQWDYSGIALDENFLNAGRWTTRSLYYDQENKVWLFFGTNHVLETKEHPSRHGYVVSILEDPRPNQIFGRVADIGVEVKKANEGAWALLARKALSDNLVGHVFEIELRRVGELYERGSSRFLCRRHLRALDSLPPKEVKDLFQTINFFRPE